MFVRGSNPGPRAQVFNLRLPLLLELASLHFLSSALHIRTPCFLHRRLSSKHSKSRPRSSGGTKAWCSKQPCGHRELHCDWKRLGWPEPITMQGRQLCSDWLVLVLGRMEASNAQQLMSGSQDVLGAEKPQQSRWFCPRQARAWTQSQLPTSVHSGSLTWYQLQN